MGMKSRFNIHEDEIQPARVKAEDGWRQLNIKFLLSRETVGCESAVLFKTVFNAAAAHDKHLHHRADELVYVIEGRGRHGQGDEEWDVGPGDSYFIPRGMPHWAYGTDADNPLTLVGVWVGGGSLEDTGYQLVERIGSAV
jgi:mannose-6-phosphate isomerase-like protein (cupin superfamily)